MLKRNGAINSQMSSEMVKVRTKYVNFPLLRLLLPNASYSRNAVNFRRVKLTWNDRWPAVDEFALHRVLPSRDRALQ